MNMSWGDALPNHPFPQPSARGISIEILPLGAQRRTLGGDLRLDYIADKHRLRVPFEGLRQTERDHLRAYYTAYAFLAKLLTLPDGQTYLVAAPNGWRESQEFLLNNTTPIYTIEITFEEI